MDRDERGPGRGAYIHRADACLRLARGKRLSRALRPPLSEDEAARLSARLSLLLRERP